MFIYVIKPNDNLGKISKIYSTTINEICNTNGIKENEGLVVGQALLINKEKIIHTVKSNETIHTIASSYGLSIDQLLKDNPILKPPYNLKIGQTLVINSPIKKTSMYINGFCYPFSSKEDYTLKDQNYSFITLFSYSLKIDGSLNKINEQPFSNNIKNKNVKKFFSVSNTKENGGFSTQNASIVLKDPKLRTNLCNNILEKLNNSIFDGVNIDFEYIKKENADDLVALVKELKVKIQNKYLLSICLAPKTRIDQKGTLYEGHKYKELGEQVDFVILMTYEWGYTFGPAMPVAPLKNIKEVLIFAVTQIPNAKILMGIPTYGYDFTNPYKKGQAAQAFPIDQGVARARKVKSSILFNNESKTPYFIYYKEQKEHEVHFEDVRSFYYKVELAKEYNLAGISLWVLSNPFIQMWNTFNEMIDLKK